MKSENHLIELTSSPSQLSLYIFSIYLSPITPILIAYIEASAGLTLADEAAAIVVAEQMMRAGGRDLANGQRSHQK